MAVKQFSLKGKEGCKACNQLAISISDIIRDRFDAKMRYIPSPDSGSVLISDNPQFARMLRSS